MEAVAEVVMGDETTEVADTMTAATMIVTVAATTTAQTGATMTAVLMTGGINPGHNSEICLVSCLTDALFLMLTDTTIAVTTTDAMMTGATDEFCEQFLSRSLGPLCYYHEPIHLTVVVLSASVMSYSPSKAISAWKYALTPFHIIISYTCGLLCLYPLTMSLLL